MKLYILLTIFFYYLENSASSPVINGPAKNLTAVAVVSITTRYVLPSLTICFLFQLYRHGDRTLKQSYPKDPIFNQAHFPEGFGTLIKVGRILNRLLK